MIPRICRFLHWWEAEAEARAIAEEICDGLMEPEDPTSVEYKQTL